MGVQKPADVRSGDAAPRVDADGWCLRQHEHGGSRHARDEALFALANGSLGVRGNFEESTRASGGCYLAAVYERHPVEFHERLPGFTRSTDTRTPVADGRHIGILLGDECVDPAECEWLDFERVLDLRSGCLHRQSTLRTPRGATIRIESERLVMLDEDLLAIRFRVTSIDYTGALTLVSSIRAGQRAASQGDDPRIGVTGSGTLQTMAARVDDNVAWLQQRTRHSGIVLVCAQLHGFIDSGLDVVDADSGDDFVSQHYRADLQPGIGFTLEKFVVYASSAGDVEASVLVAQATRRLALAATVGHAALVSKQTATLSSFWRVADLAVDDDAGTALALRFNLFHLLQSASRNQQHGTAAKGLTGEGYEGHCFWDTEVFVLPVLALTAPSIARSMLGFRHHTLDAARANARAMNHRCGALYPWRTIAGGECSAHYPSGAAAYHINADIAYAIGLYFDATDDVGFLLDAGAEMLFETARIWPQAGHFDALRDGAFGIHCVTGPDEYTALVDNNFYTNRMAQRHLQRAVAVWERLSVEHPRALDALATKLALTVAEVDEWRHAAEKMLLPVDARLDIHAQDDSFLHKPRWDFAAHANDRPLLLDYHPLTLYRHQVCKQADVVMALVLAGDGLDAARKRRSFDYYEAITTHDSTLSPAIHGILASELGLREKAARYFSDALRIDLDDLHGNTHHGVHMAAMAGSWLGVVMGFAGLRVVAAALNFTPTLPDGWRSYRFGLQWRERRLLIDVDRNGVNYRLAEGAPLLVTHCGAPLQLTVGAITHAPLDVDIDRAESGRVAFPRVCDALIFDLDGVLTDTARAHYRAWKRVADEIGVAFDQQINARLKGIDRAGSLDIILERAVRAFTPAEKRAACARKNGYYVDSIASFGPRDLFPGALDLLHDARRAGLRIALASASRNAPALLARLGIAEQFDAVIDAAQIAQSKPHPEIFLAAAHALGVTAARCIGIEDAAAGVAAIKAAGMAAIGIGATCELAQADAVLPAIGALKLEAFVCLR